jgi:hypothetical protein
MKRRLIMNSTGNMKTDQAEIRGNRQEGQNGDQVTTKKPAGGVANHREMRQAGQTPANALRPPHHALTAIMENVDILVWSPRAGSVINRAYSDPLVGF